MALVIRIVTSGDGGQEGLQYTQSVVLVDQDNHLLAGLGVGPFDETFQTLVRQNKYNVP